MVCDDVRRVAYFFLDGALGDSKRVDFERHLSDCPDCDNRVRFHEQIRRFLRKRLARVNAPARLRERVGSVLQGAQVGG